MFRFYLQGFYLFRVSSCAYFMRLYKSAIVPASVAWVVRHAVEWAIPAFDFWEEAEPSRMVDSMASSASEGCFGNHSGSLEREGVFLVCKECTQVSP